MGEETEKDKDKDGLKEADSGVAAKEKMLKEADALAAKEELDHIKEHSASMMEAADALETKNKKEEADIKKDEDKLEESTKKNEADSKEKEDELKKKHTEEVERQTKKIEEDFETDMLAIKERTK